jgi:hypothetical protein
VIYRFRKSLLLVVLPLLISSCAAPVNRAADRAFKKVDASESKAIVYVWKPYHPANCGGVPLDRGVTVSFLGKRPVKLDCEEYAVFSFDPGEVIVSLDKALDLQGTKAPLVTKLEAGQEYCLNIHWHVERLPGRNLQLIPGGALLVPRSRSFLAYTFGQNCNAVFSALYRVHDEPAL